MDNAVGFYWTLPVTWAQFTDLPSDIEGAAASSQTIRYQMEVIRRYAKNYGYDLVKEEVFMEVAPDRGSALVRSSLGKIEALCREQDATILIVDFSLVQNWRRHGYMDEWFEQTETPVVRIPPDQLLSAEWSFDPAAHFEDWRERHYRWSATKPEREEYARARATVLKAAGLSYPAIALKLNSEQTPSPTGKPWGESNVRAFLKKHAG